MKIIDIHVHFFPKKLFEAVWKYFETQSHGLWKIHYKIFGEELVTRLKEFNVSRFTSLVYAHKSGVADSLNQFVFESSQTCPEMIPFGTIFVGDGESEKKARMLFEDYGFYGIKLHPFVSKEQIDDVRFFPVYEMMESLGKVLICHPGSGPVYEEKDGADRLKTVLKKFPKLKVIVAHCGAFEYGDYTSLADAFDFVYFDTAMNCIHTPVFHNNCPGPDFFTKYSDRILFGSDFPNIPYHYNEQIEAVRSMSLGLKIEEQIFSQNAVDLLGL